MFVNETSVLEKEVVAVVDSLVCGWEYGTSGAHDEVVATNAVNVEYGVDDAYGLFGGFEHHGCGTVAEQRACGAVLIVDH